MPSPAPPTGFDKPLVRGGPGFSTLATVRSRVMLEIAWGLVGDESWSDKQIAIDFKAQGAPTWVTRIFASDGWDAVSDVLDGTVALAILNPATAVSAAARRHGASVDELAGIATIPSYDQLGFAVRADLGISTLEELIEAKQPLRVSLRGARPNHSLHIVMEDALAAAGTSLDEIASWGSEISYDQGLAQEPHRMAKIKDGLVDAVFDEGVYNWCEAATHAGLRFLDLSPASFEVLESKGYRRSVLSRKDHPELHDDVHAVDFSGFLMYTRADAPDDIVRPFCSILAERREKIAWEGGLGLPLERMVGDAVDSPMPIPLHEAAFRTWENLGLL